MPELFEVKVVDQEDPDIVAKEIVFTWKVTEITEGSVQFKLDFEEPILVSNGDYDKHSVQVKIKQKHMLISESGSMLDPNTDHALISILPMQYEKGSAVEKMADAT